MSNKERRGAEIYDDTSFVPFEQKKKYQEEKSQGKEEKEKMKDEFCLIPIRPWGSHTPHTMFLGM